MKMKSESGSQAEGAVGVRHTPLIFQKSQWRERFGRKYCVGCLNFHHESG